MVLADHIIVENLADFLRCWNAVTRFHQRGLLLMDDVLAQLDAFVANEHGRTGNKLAHVLLALAAERAVELILRIAAGHLPFDALRQASMVHLNDIDLEMTTLCR